MPSGMPASGPAVPAASAASAATAAARGAIRRLDDEGVERPRRLDRRDVGVGDLDRGEVARAQPVAQRRDAEIGEHYSITLGTAKKPWPVAGAFAKHRVAHVAVGDDIGAPRQRLGDHCGHRRDARRIDLAKLLDPAKDGVQLTLEPRDLGIVDANAREMRDALDGGGIDGHATGLACRSAARQAAPPRAVFSWRSGWDSNPRRAFDPYTLSRRAPSTTRPPLRRRAVSMAVARAQKDARCRGTPGVSRGEPGKRNPCLAAFLIRRMKLSDWKTL